MDFQGLGEPVGHVGGTGQPILGGTARAGNSNAYLIQKVRTPSGKPGWGKISFDSLTFFELWGLFMNWLPVEEEFFLALVV